MRNTMLLFVACIAMVPGLLLLYWSTSRWEFVCAAAVLYFGPMVAVPAAERILPRRGNMSERLTEDDLVQLDALSKMATPGPWYVGNTGTEDPGWVELSPPESDESERGICQVFTGTAASGLVADAGWDSNGRLAYNSQQQTNAAFIAAARMHVPRLLAEVRALRAEFAKVQQVVNEQADDPGLWSEAQTVPEAHLQKALRTIHAVIEKEPK